jgi:hypothetical protein
MTDERDLGIVKKANENATFHPLSANITVIIGCLPFLPVSFSFD